MRRSLMLFLVSVALASPVWAKTDRPISKSFPAQAGGRIIVDADLGDIEVRSADVPRVDVTVHRLVHADSAERIEKILKRVDVGFSQSGDAIKVEIDMDGSSQFFHFSFGNDLELRTVVTVPRQFNLELSTSGGDIDVAQVAGDLSSRTSGGDVRFSRVSGKIHGRTSGGDIRVIQTRADADVSTSGGDIELAGVFGPVQARTSGGDIVLNGAAGSVDARTSGGDITIGASVAEIVAKTSGGSIDAKLSAAPRGTVDLTTSGGNLTVALPASAAFNLDAESSGGRVEVDFPGLVKNGMARESVSGQVNGGGAKIRLRTSAGSVRVISSAAAR